MSSLTISRFKLDGESDRDTAERLAKSYGYCAVIRYKNEENADEFTHFGTCETASELDAYLTSSSCHDAEVIYREKIPGDEAPLAPESSGSELFDLDVPGEDVPLPIHHTAVQNDTGQAGEPADQEDVLDPTNDDGYSPLHIASEKGHTDFVKKLIAMGTDANIRDDKNWTPLHLAARSGHVEPALILLENHGDPNIKTQDFGYTPLHLAAHGGRLDIIRLLADHDADINLKTSDGTQAIHIAAEFGKTDVIRLLLEKGADLNTRDRHERTPLHCAAEKNYYKSAAVLLENGADPNAVNASGTTSLHDAALYNYPDLISVLLKFGADPEIKNRDGKTPIDVAKEEEQTNAVLAMQQSLPSDTQGPDPETTDSLTSEDQPKSRISSEPDPAEWPAAQDDQTDMADTVHNEKNDIDDTGALAPEIPAQAPPDPEPAARKKPRRVSAFLVGGFALAGLLLAVLFNILEKTPEPPVTQVPDQVITKAITPPAVSEQIEPSSVTKEPAVSSTGTAETAKSAVSDAIETSDVNDTPGAKDTSVSLAEDKNVDVSIIIPSQDTTQALSVPQKERSDTAAISEKPSEAVLATPSDRPSDPGPGTSPTEGTSAESQPTAPSSQAITVSGESAAQPPEQAPQAPSAPTASVPAPVAEKTPYHIIVGSFKDPGNADKLFKRLKAAGFDDTATLSRDKNTLVSVGAFADIKAARNKKDALLKQFNMESWILIRK